LRCCVLVNRVLRALLRRPFSIVGHRGAAGLAPENTIKALEKAIEVGADLAEFDVQVTADGVPVVVHDENLERLTGRRINVREIRVHELRDIRVQGEPIPTLEELLAKCDARIPLLIEVKHPEDTGRVIDVIRGIGGLEWCSIISFWDEALRTARSLEPRMVTGLIYAKPPGRIIEARRLGCRIVLPHYRLATIRANALAHRLGLIVVAWTVNDVDTALRLVKSGVDAIATDYPDKLAGLRGGL